MDDLNAEIERRQAIADAATPDWNVDDAVIWTVGMVECAPTCDPETGEPLSPNYEPEQVQIGGFGCDADATFATHARTGYPQCLEALKLAVAALNQRVWSDDGLSREEGLAALAAIKRALETK